LHSQGDISDEDKLKAECFKYVSNGISWINYTFFIVYLQELRGPLARQIQLASGFLDALVDIGSSQARSVLNARLIRASHDPAAQQLRAEVDGSSAASTTPSTEQMELWMQTIQQSIAASAQQAVDAAIQRMTPVQVNVNKTPRSNEDLLRINLPAPTTLEEADALAKRTLFVTDFLRNFLPKMIPGIEDVPNLLQQLVTAVRTKFAGALMQAKAERGTVVRCGQLGRSQPHYEMEDAALMTSVAADLHDYIFSKFQEVGHAAQHHGAVFADLLESARKRRRDGIPEGRRSDQVGGWQNRADAHGTGR